MEPDFSGQVLISHLAYSVSTSAHLNSILGGLVKCSIDLVKLQIDFYKLTTNICISTIDHFKLQIDNSSCESLISTWRCLCKHVLAWMWAVAR